MLPGRPGRGKPHPSVRPFGIVYNGTPRHGPGRLHVFGLGAEAQRTIACLDCEAKPQAAMEQASVRSKWRCTALAPALGFYLQRRTTVAPTLIFSGASAPVLVFAKLYETLAQRSGRALAVTSLRESRLHCRCFQIRAQIRWSRPVQMQAVPSERLFQ